MHGISIKIAMNVIGPRIKYLPYINNCSCALATNKTILTCFI